MANRAYLYSSDRPDAWGCPDKDYYDSRWTIPLAWFFFFRPDDIRMVDVPGSHWQEVKLSAERHCGLALFAARQPLLSSLIGDRPSRETIANFVATVESRSGRYLLIEPEEVLDENQNVKMLTRFLILLASGEELREPIREAVQLFVGDLSQDPERREGQVIGYTYW